MNGPFFVFYVAGENVVTETGTEDFETAEEFRDWFKSKLEEHGSSLNVWIVQGGIKREYWEIEQA